MLYRQSGCETKREYCHDMFPCSVVCIVELFTHSHCNTVTLPSCWYGENVAAVDLQSTYYHDYCGSLYAIYIVSRQLGDV